MRTPLRLLRPATAPTHRKDIEPHATFEATDPVWSAPTIKAYARLSKTPHAGIRALSGPFARTLWSSDLRESVKRIASLTRSVRRSYRDFWEKRVMLQRECGEGQVLLSRIGWGHEHGLLLGLYRRHLGRDRTDGF